MMFPRLPNCNCEIPPQVEVETPIIPPFHKGGQGGFSDSTQAHTNPLPLNPEPSNTCGTCRWLEVNDGTPYCIISDYFTHRYEDSPACDNYDGL